MKIIFLAVLLLHLYDAVGQPPFRGSVKKTFDKNLLASFPLQTTGGKRTHLQLPSKKITVFVFLSPGCPLSKNYSPRLSTLKKKYKEQVNFIGIIPGEFEAQEINEFHINYLSAWTLLTDKTLKLTHYLEGKVTPEVLVFNNRDGSLIYQGAIDDWAVSLGQTRNHYVNFYLDEALHNFLHNKKVEVSYHKPVGCFINDF